MNAISRLIAALGAGLALVNSGFAGIDVSPVPGELETNPHSGLVGLGHTAAVDGDTIVAAQRYWSGNPVSIFEFNGSAWSETEIGLNHLNGIDFGVSVAVDGALVAVGSNESVSGYNSGSVFIYEKTSTGWVERTKLTPPDGAAYDYFGCSVAVSDTANTDRVIVGAYGNDGGGNFAGAVYVYRRSNGQTAWVLESKLMPPSAEHGFGHRVSFDGRRLLVSAPYYDEASLGSNGSDVGRLFMYQEALNVWSQKKILQTSSVVRYSYLGYESLEVHGDTIAAFQCAQGLYSDRSVVLFRETSPGVWSENKIPAQLTNTTFASHISLENKILVVGEGSYDSGVTQGRFFIYERNGDLWQLAHTINNPDPSPIPTSGFYNHDFFGEVVDYNEGRLVVTALGQDTSFRDSGRVYVYSLGVTGSRMADVNDSEMLETNPHSGLIGLGYTAAMDGNILVSSQRYWGYGNPVSIFEKNGSSWTETEIGANRLTSEYEFGVSVSVSGNLVAVGTNANVGGYAAGSVCIYEKGSSGWVEQTVVRAPDPSAYAYFGSSLAIVDRLTDDILVVGAYGDDAAGNFAGAVYTYRRIDGQSAWTFEQKLLPTGAEQGFGYQLAFDGRRLVVAAPHYDETSLGTSGNDRGRLFLYDFDGMSWNPQGSLISDYAVRTSYLGYFSVVLDGNTIAASSVGGGLNANQSVIVFTQTESSGWKQRQLLAPLAVDSTYGNMLAMDEGLLAVGEYNYRSGTVQGRVHMYERAGEFWELSQIIDNPTPSPIHPSFSYARDAFGLAIAMDDGKLAITSRGQDTTFLDSGRIHVFPLTPEILTLPQNGQEVKLSEGVVFAFNLDGLDELPEKIRISKRAVGSAWELVGNLTDISEIDGVRLVRGSAIWVADTTGLHEVKAEAYDDLNNLVAISTRLVYIETNSAPTISITGLTSGSNPSSFAVPAAFTTTVQDPDGDVIRRVEFFANGVYLGADLVAPFGDQLSDPLGNQVFPYLYRGVHSITAKAYDSARAVGQTTAPLVVTVTAGPALPELVITAPQDGSIIQKGQTLVVQYTATHPDGFGLLDYVEAYKAGGGTFFGSATYPDPIQIDTTHLDPGSYLMVVEVTDSLSYRSFPRYLRFEVTDGSPGTSFAETLVAKIAEETTASPSGEIFTGIEASSNVFNGGTAAGLQFNSGILLTSGGFHLWDNGDSLESSAEMWESPGDDQLTDKVAGGFTKDAAALEFDVYCEDSQLELVLQFGSEEYLEWVSDLSRQGCKNDAIMVTVDGVVVSLVPGGSDIIAVNNIHPLITGAESNCPSIVDYLEADNEHLYIDDSEIGGGPGKVEYDGMTERLRLHAFVKPGESHRVRIVVADVDDADFDSGLFLKEGSLRTVDPAQ